MRNQFLTVISFIVISSMYCCTCFDQRGDTAGVKRDTSSANATADSSGANKMARVMASMRQHVKVAAEARRAIKFSESSSVHNSAKESEELLKLIDDVGFSFSFEKEYISRPQSASMTAKWNAIPRTAEANRVYRNARWIAIAVGFQIFMNPLAENELLSSDSRVMHLPGSKAGTYDVLVGILDQKMGVMIASAGDVHLDEVPLLEAMDCDEVFEEATDVGECPMDLQAWKEFPRIPSFNSLQMPTFNHTVISANPALEGGRKLVLMLDQLEQTAETLESELDGTEENKDLWASIERLNSVDDVLSWPPSSCSLMLDPLQPYIITFKDGFETHPGMEVLIDGILMGVSSHGHVLLDRLLPGCHILSLQNLFGRTVIRRLHVRSYDASINPESRLSNVCSSAASGHGLTDRCEHMSGFDDGYFSHSSDYEPLQSSASTAFPGWSSMVINLGRRKDRWLNASTAAGGPALSMIENNVPVTRQEAYDGHAASCSSSRNFYLTRRRNFKCPGGALGCAFSHLSALLHFASPNNLQSNSNSDANQNTQHKQAPTQVTGNAAKTTDKMLIFEDDAFISRFAREHWAEVTKLMEENQPEFDMVCIGFSGFSDMEPKFAHGGGRKIDDVFTQNEEPSKGWFPALDRLKNANDICLTHALAFSKSGAQAMIDFTSMAGVIAGWDWQLGVMYGRMRVYAFAPSLAWQRDKTGDTDIQARHNK